MIRTRRSVPGSTLSELVVNLSPLCVPDTKRDTNKTENCFSLALAALFVSWWISQQLIRHFLPYLWLPPVRKLLRFVVYVCTQRLTQDIIPKGRVPVFFVPNSFWATKGHGRGRRSLVLSRDVGTSFLWFRSPWNNGTNWLCVWVASFNKTILPFIHILRITLR